MVTYNDVDYFYVYNLQGDVVALIDANGTQVVEYGYDAWGYPISKTGSLAATIGTLNPFRYRGYVYDEETGLYYLRSRYYNPEWKRFVNADVIMEGNAYSYCNDNPCNLTDDEGELPRGFMHEAVCDDIVEKSAGTLFKTGVKIVEIPGKAYGRADIRTADGMIWEVKRVTCSPNRAFRQVEGYLGGRWGSLKTGNNQPVRGDNRPISGVITKYPGYIGYYMNVGNGYILYDYIRLTNLEQETATGKVKESVSERAPAFGGASKISMAPVLGMGLGLGAAFGSEILHGGIGSRNTYLFY